MSFHEVPVDIVSEIIKRMFPHDILCLMLTCKSMSMIVKKTNQYAIILKLYTMISDYTEVIAETSKNYYVTTERMSATLRYIGKKDSLTNYSITIYIATQYGDMHITYVSYQPKFLRVISKNGQILTFFANSANTTRESSKFIMRRLILHLFGRFAHTSGLIDFLDNFTASYVYEYSELKVQVGLCNEYLQ